MPLLACKSFVYRIRFAFSSPSSLFVSLNPRIPVLSTERFTERAGLDLMYVLTCERRVFIWDIIIFVAVFYQELLQMSGVERTLVELHYAIQLGAESFRDLNTTSEEFLFDARYRHDFVEQRAHMVSPS